MTEESLEWLVLKPIAFRRSCHIFDQKVWLITLFLLLAQQELKKLEKTYALA